MKITFLKIKAFKFLCFSKTWNKSWKIPPVTRKNRGFQFILFFFFSVFSDISLKMAKSLKNKFSVKLHCFS